METNKYLVVVQVQGCPNENNNIPADDRLAYADAVKAAMGDTCEVKNCEHILSKDKHQLFCEMLFECERPVNRSKLPSGMRVIIERLKEEKSDV